MMNVIKSIQDLYNEIQIFHNPMYFGAVAKSINCTIYMLDNNQLGKYTLNLNQAISNKYSGRLLNLNTMFGLGIIDQACHSGLDDFFNTLIDERVVNLEKGYKLEFEYMPIAYKAIQKIIYIDNQFISNINLLKKNLSTSNNSKSINSEYNSQVNANISKNMHSVEDKSYYYLTINADEIYKKIDHIDIYFYAIGDLADVEIGNITIRHSEIKSLNDISVPYNNILANNHLVIARVTMTDGSMCDVGSRFGERIAFKSQNTKSKNFIYDSIDHDMFDANLSTLNPDRQILFKFNPQCIVLDGITTVDYSKIFYATGFKFILRDNNNIDVTDKALIVINKKKDYDLYYNAINFNRQILSIQRHPSINNIQIFMNYVNIFASMGRDLSVLGDFGELLAANFNSDTIASIIQNPNNDFKSIFKYWWNIIDEDAPMYDKTKSFADITNKWANFNQAYIGLNLSNHNISLADFDIGILINHNQISTNHGSLNVYVRYPNIVYTMGFNRNDYMKFQDLYVNDSTITNKIYLYDDKYKSTRDVAFGEQLLYQITIV